MTDGSLHDYKMFKQATTDDDPARIRCWINSDLISFP